MTKKINKKKVWKKSESTCMTQLEGPITNTLHKEWIKRMRATVVERNNNGEFSKT